MNEEMLVIDGCAFAEGEFTGVTEEVHQSELDAFFLTTPGEADCFTQCVNEIGKVYNLTDKKDKKIVIAKTAEDIYRAKKEGKKAIILAFQDPKSIGDSLDRLRVFYELGIRVIQMTYNHTNYIGTGCIESVDGGLTDFGKNVLKKMNELGIIADISHCGKKTGIDVLKYSEKPIVISHAGVNFLTENPRNKTDEELKLLKENGGVIGLSSWGPLCWKKETKRRPTLGEFVDHIDYVVNLIGIDHVGFGGDSTLDDSKDEKGLAEQSTTYPAVVKEYNECIGIDPNTRHAEGVKGSWQIKNVINELDKRGYSKEDINKFTGGNFMRVIKEVWK